MARTAFFSLVAILALAASIPAHAGEATIPELIEIVRAGIHQHTPDKTLAKSLRKLTLGESLDLRTIEELESEGAGPDTIAALGDLRDASVFKPASTALPPFKSPAHPTVDEQKEFFHRLDVNAMHYTASLPDFISTEIVTRYQSIPRRRPGADTPRGRQSAVTPVAGAGVWFQNDVLTVKLSYFANREKYELLLINGKKTKATYEASGGAISEGDFGSTLLEIFAPESKTIFTWDHWTHLRKRLTRVYAYHTKRETSHYAIGVGGRDGRNVIVGRHGFVYADDETAMVMRLTGEAESIPRGFPVIGQSTVMDYDYANVGDKRFLLPLRVDNRMMSAQTNYKNVVEFKDYRKFTGESTITFDSPDLPPGPPPDTPPSPEKK